MKKLLFVLIVVIQISCTKPAFNQKWANEKAPENFITRFETSKGKFDIQINRADSPKAVDRFYQLVNHQFLDSTIFYRVVPNFVAQFGISDTLRMSKWQKIRVPDEEVRVSNTKGALSFARGGKESRSSDLFINLKDNLRLDTLNYNNVKGFPAFGKVINGMKVVESLYSGYGDQVMPVYDTLSVNRTRFLNAFPKLDLINKVYIIKTKNK